MATTFFKNGWLFRSPTPIICRRVSLTVVPGCGTAYLVTFVQQHLYMILNLTYLRHHSFEWVLTRHPCNPIQILHAVRRSGGMQKNALFKGRSTLVAMVTTAACSRPGASFSYKNVAKKRVKCLFLYLKLNTTLQIGTSTIHSDIIRLHFDSFNFLWEWMWTHQ